MRAKRLMSLLAIVVVLFAATINVDAITANAVEQIEVVMTQDFSSNTAEDWEPLLPSSKGDGECRSVVNDCLFVFENIAQPSNKKYLTLYADGQIKLPKVNGQIKRVEVRLYEEQPFSSLCNLRINNEEGSRERMLEVDARDESMLGDWVAFPYDLTIVYPENSTRLVISTEKKVYITGLRITYLSDDVEDLLPPRFILPEWMGKDHSFCNPFSLTIESDIDEANILYSRDSEDWLTYTSSLVIDDSCDIYAKIVKNGQQSEVAHISFIKIKNEVGSIDELLTIGAMVKSEIDDKDQLIANPIGLLTITSPLQVLAQSGSLIFVADTTDNFQDCIAIRMADEQSHVDNAATIPGGLQGYFVMVDDVAPLFYVVDKVEAYSAKSEMVRLIDLLGEEDKWVNQYVRLENCHYDEQSESLMYDGVAVLPIENIFGVEIGATTNAQIEGIMVYSSSHKRVVLAPLSVICGDMPDGVKECVAEHYNLESLPYDALIYGVNGQRVTRERVETGIYIIHIIGQRPFKAVIDR